MNPKTDQNEEKPVYLLMVIAYILVIYHYSFQPLSSININIFSYPIPIGLIGFILLVSPSFIYFYYLFKSMEIFKPITNSQIIGAMGVIKKEFKSNQNSLKDDKKLIESIRLELRISKRTAKKLLSTIHKNMWRLKDEQK